MSTRTAAMRNPVTADLLESLRRGCPEWAPWLAAVQATLEECANPAWDELAAALGATPPPRSEPVLAGVKADGNAAVVSRWRRHLHEVAERSWGGTAVADERDAALASLAPVPFLQAFQRRWGERAKAGWVSGCCPICGAQPALVEERGDDRTREFRCAQCGAGWTSLPLRCPFCGNTDHESLVSLVARQPSTAEGEEPPGAGSGPGAAVAAAGAAPVEGVVDACGKCFGYVKRFTTLEPCAPEAVMLKDLATVALDLVAISNGYHRPAATNAWRL